MLVVLFSSNVFAEVTEQDYIDEAKERASIVLVSKFYWSDGKYVYNLWDFNKGTMAGQIEARASELCGKNGYKLLREETNDSGRRQIIQCNE